MAEYQARFPPESILIIPGFVTLLSLEDISSMAEYQTRIPL
jgi:hypothetical protein